MALAGLGLGLSLIFIAVYLIPCCCFGPLSLPGQEPPAWGGCVTWNCTLPFSSAGNGAPGWKWKGGQGSPSSLSAAFLVVSQQGDLLSHSMDGETEAGTGRHDFWLSR